VRFITKKRAAAAAAAVVIAGGGMAAYAYWTGGGSGSGSATATTPVNLVVNQTNAAITNLFPGGPAQALSGDFNNANSGPITLTSLTAAVRSFSVQSNPAKPACTQADFAITGTATIGGSGVVPAGTGVGSWSGLNVSLTNAASANQDNCKGVSVTIDYTAS
jgi:hypothetical protein